MSAFTFLNLHSCQFLYKNLEKYTRICYTTNVTQT